MSYDTNPYYNPEADATPDEAFELGRIAGYDEGRAEGWNAGLNAAVHTIEDVDMTVLDIDVSLPIIRLLEAMQHKGF
jgi:flagellar biosynthesis/type III secretory pathway protein FliH